MTSSTTLLPLLNMNYARSVWPSAFCTFVSASSSVLLRIALLMIIFETSKLLKYPECFRLTALLAHLASSLLFSWPLLSSLLIVCYYYDINSVMYSCILFFPQIEYTKSIYWTPLVTFLQSLLALFVMKQALGFQIPWIKIFRFGAQRSWETIGNNFLVLGKFMGTHFYFF